MEQNEHVSSELLWKTVKSGKSLDKVYVEHAKICRDCREFIEEFQSEARAKGLTVPQLLPAA